MNNSKVVALLFALAVACGAPAGNIAYADDLTEGLFDGPEQSLVEGDALAGEGWEFSADSKTLTISGALPSWHDGVNSEFAPWTDLRKDIETVNIDAGASATTCYQMFSGCINLTAINGLENLNTSSVTDMSGMFSTCVSLFEIDVSSLDTSNVTDMSGMFTNCYNLQSVNVEGIDTRNVALMGAMFYQCESLASLDLSSIDTSSLQNMDMMFMQCYSLEELDLSSFSGSPSMRMVFWDCLFLTRFSLGPDFALGEMYTLPRTGAWTAHSSSGLTRLYTNEDMTRYQESSSDTTLYAVEGFSEVDYNGSRVKYWYDMGVPARNKEVYDPGQNAWLWFDADGTQAKGKDVYLPGNNGAEGKWVRYNEAGLMVKGEHCLNGNWYYFDPITGEMAHGEKYFDYDAAHTGWYLFDPITGIMFHGDTYIRSNGGKWVRYDLNTGIMVHGIQYWDGSWYYFDHITGAMAHGSAWVPEWGRYHWFDSITGRG